jgi:hypothetical protein
MLNSIVVVVTGKCVVVPIAVVTISHETKNLFNDQSTHRPKTKTKTTESDG